MRGRPRDRQCVVVEKKMADTNLLAGRSHAICITRGEVIFSAVVFLVGVGVSTLSELLFGEPERVFSITIDAIQGSLFWSVIVIGLARLGRVLYRGVRSRLLREVV